MNLLLLPFPDEVLLEYLSPQDMISLCKTNSVYYKNFKPLIYKAVKNYVILRQGSFTKKVLDGCLPHEQNYSFLGLSYNPYESVDIPTITILYHQYNDSVGDLAFFIEKALKKQQLMDEDDEFIYYVFREYFNKKDESLSISHFILRDRLGYLIGMQFHVYNYNSSGICTGKICVFNFYKKRGFATNYKQEYCITPTYCII